MAPRNGTAAIDCTDIGVPFPECDVNNSLYGYEPNLGVNAFFAAFFGICLLAQLILGIRYKTWTYMIALGLGCLGEMIGYIGRIMLHNNVYDELGMWTKQDVQRQSLTAHQASRSRFVA